MYSFRALNQERDVLKKIKSSFVKLFLNKQAKKNITFSDIKVKNGDIVIDCGANVGDITYYFSKLGAVVHAFEPNPYAYKVLKDRFSNQDSVYCYQQGVFNKNDHMNLYLHEHSDQDQLFYSTGSSLLDFKSNVLKDQYVEIEVIDLCEFIESLNSRVKLLKMDVEGVECLIIKELIETRLVNKIDYIFVETHERKNPALKKETDDIRVLIKKNRINNINLNWR